MVAMAKHEEPQVSDRSEEMREVLIFVRRLCLEFAAWVERRYGLEGRGRRQR